MKKVTEIVAELAAEAVAQQGCELWDVEYVREGAEYFLRLYIDKEGGVSIDDCEAVSRPVSDLLDEADILRMIRDTHALGYTGNYYLQFFFEPDKGKTLGNLEPPKRRYDRRLLDDMSPLKIGYRNFPEDRYR